jgi:hypothetical protein
LLDHYGSGLRAQVVTGLGGSPNRGADTKKMSHCTRRSRLRQKEGQNRLQRCDGSIPAQEDRPVVE